MAEKQVSRRDYLYFTEAEVRAFLKCPEARIQNCVVGDVRLDMEDHGILDLSIPLDGDGWGTCLGGYALDGPSGQTFEHDREPCIVLSYVIQNLMHVIGSITKCNGTIVRSLHNENRTLAIGHALKDKWFCFPMVVDFVRGEFPIHYKPLKEMLYPQFQHYFEKTLTTKEWEWLQEEARFRLRKDHAAPAVEEHWRSIARGNLPWGFTIDNQL